MHTAKSYLPMKRFSISRRNSKILFTDEKIFNFEEKFNHQNNHIYAKKCSEAKDKIPRIQSSHRHPTPIRNGLVGSFVLWRNSFLQRRCKSEW